MSYYRLWQKTVVFDHLEKTSVPKQWVFALPGTLIRVTREPVMQRAVFIVIDGPAKDYWGEIWLGNTTPISALEILAEAAE